MKWNKWVLFGLLASSAGMALAQNAAKDKDVRTLDIIIRDFQPNHSDFENFSEEAVVYKDYITNYLLPANIYSPLNGLGLGVNSFGYDVNWYNLENPALGTYLHSSCGNRASDFVNRARGIPDYLSVVLGTPRFGSGVAIGKDGYPMVANPYLPPYLQTVSAYAAQYEAANATMWNSSTLQKLVSLPTDAQKVQELVDNYPDLVDDYTKVYYEVRDGKDKAGVLMYGECSESTESGITQRGYANAADDVKGFKCKGNANGSNAKMVWVNPVIYTPGMVRPFLTVPAPNAKGEIDMYEVQINRQLDANGLPLNLCDNTHFDEWFRDVPGVNLRIDATMDIPVDGEGSKYYVYDYNYNNGGYSPLDLIDPATRAWVGPAPCREDIQVNKVCEQFGPQSLSIFCPPYNYKWASSQKDYKGLSTDSLCRDWLSYGGPRAVNVAGTNVSAAVLAVNNYSTAHPNYTKTVKGDMYVPEIGSMHLRNYAFTMMGYASFKYKKSNQTLQHEVFEFSGDDDMWIFVDGVLVVDLGGVHNAAPGKVDIEVLAKNNHGCDTASLQPLAGYKNCNGASWTDGWADGSWHHLHFFYADRQSDGSNIYIRTSLAELAPSRYGQPKISDALVEVKDDGSFVTSVYMNVPLTQASLDSIRSNPNSPTMLVLRKSKTPDGRDTTLVLGYYITQIDGPDDAGALGQKYTIKGKVKDISGVEYEGGLLGGDLLAFNVPWSQPLDDGGNEGNFTDGEWNQLMLWSHLITFPVSSALGKVEGFDEKELWGKVTYTAKAETPIVPDDPAYERPDFTEAAQKLTDLAGSGTLPLDKTADLVLIPISNTNGIDPLKYAVDSAKTLMKSGANGEVPPGTVVFGAGITNPADQSDNKTLCYNDGSNASGGVSNESCMSLSFPTTQPFRVNIRVFDHLGHFVNQYNKTVTKEEFENALMGQRASTKNPGVSVSGCDDKPMFGATGAMLATIKMYPVTDKGRVIATGPYIYQMTVVKEANTYCYASNGNQPTIMNLPFQRTTETFRRGYRRSVKSQPQQ